MKFKSFDNNKEINLLDCPFCGADPIVKHIGNDYTRKRSIEIKCHKCYVKRIDATLKHNFNWLETVAAENWNKRCQ